MNLKYITSLLFIFFIFIAFAPQAFAEDVNSTQINDMLQSSDMDANLSASEYWYESQPTKKSETVSYNGGNKDIEFYSIIDDYFGRPDSPRYFGNLKLYVYINDDSTNRVELKDYNGAASNIQFNLKLIESKLHDGENKITVHPDENQMKSYTCYQYNFNPATVYYNTESYSYSTSPYPATVDYIIGENRTVAVDVRYNKSLNESLKDLDMYMFINNNMSIKLDGVKATDANFTVNLFDFKDYLTAEKNSIIFHPNLDGITNSTLFNKLTVNIVEPIYDYYISTPDPSAIDEYERNTDENITVYTEYWDGLSQILGLIDMCVYINDVEGYNWDFIRGVSANETTFTFNLKNISSDLQDGQNKLYFAPYTKNFFNIFKGDNYTFNPLIINVKKAPQADDYISTPTPSEVLYKLDSSQIVKVNITYPSSADIKGYSMFVYINGEEEKNRVKIDGVDSGATSFSYDLAKISDKLVEGVNNLTFHPNPGLLEYEVRGDLIFNPLIVKVISGLINTTLSVNSTLNVSIGKNSSINAKYSPENAGISYSSSNSSIASVDEKGIVTGLKEGSVNITVIVGDGEFYRISTANVTVTVSEAPALINTSVVADENMELYVGDNSTIKANTTPEGLDIKFESNDTSVITVDAKGNVVALGAGNATITLTVGDDIVYAINSTTVSVTVSKIPTAVCVDTDSMTLNVSDETTVTPKTTPEDLNVTYTSNDTSVISVDEKGKVSALSNGTALVTVKVAETEKYQASEAIITVTVNSKEEPVIPKKDLNASVSADEIIVGEDALIKVTGLENATGNVTASVNEDVYISIIIDGSAKIYIVGLIENTTAIVNYAGDDNYNNFTKSVEIIVNPIVPKENVTMNITAEPITEGENATIVVTLPSDAKGNVTAVNVTSPVINGTATLIVENLAKGNHTIHVTYSGDDRYNPASGDVNVTVKGYESDIIFAPDVIKYYSGPERFVVSVSDVKGNPIANKSVEITINGVSYQRKTNVNGTASIPLGLPSGVYNVTVVMNNQTVNSTASILTTVNGTDLTKVFRNATQYYATFRDSKGNYLAEGTEIEFNINGVFYTRKVAANGLAKLNINLEQGEYIITAKNTQTNELSSNVITVIPRITENNDLTKYYRNASQYTVKIIGDDGKAVGAGENVTFNINGVFYTRTTNASGIAKLNINLEPGKYIITAYYGGCSVANNITVLPVLSASDLTKKYGTPDQFVATLVNGQGQAFVGESITFNINGVFYQRTTDSEGNARLNINLMPGEYIITSSYNGQNIANTVKVNA
ncbi:Ig-like domain repeat protein [Methanobrevibacter sp.]|uniref:Ig-like domain repeat protein n=1 Tax=Methanobrevibacter sp. TaxID=66852 RepID=UPI0038910FCB